MMRWLKQVYVGALLLALSACAANPLRYADTLEQRGYAAYGTFVIAEESVARLTAPGSTLPRDAQLSMIGVAERAQPVVDDLRSTLAEYQTARADFEAQRVEVGAFQTVVNSLNDWVTRAEKVVAELLASTKRRE